MTDYKKISQSRTCATCSDTDGCTYTTADGVHVKCMITCKFHRVIDTCDVDDDKNTE